MSATGWLIAGGIILFIIILLAIPVVIRFEYGKTLYLKVRYLFITVYRVPSRPKKKKRGKQKKQSPPENSAETAATDAQSKATDAVEEVPAETKSEEPKQEKKAKSKEKNPKIPSLNEIFELVKAFFDSLGKPLKKLCRRIKISDFDLRMICGGEDAAKAALKFGTMNLAVGNALGHLGSWFTLKEPHIDINVDFQSEETVAECSCTVRVSALVALAFVFSFAGRLLWRVLRNSAIMGYLRRLTGKSGKKQKKSKKSRKGK